jgi:hypothetical protein
VILPSMLLIGLSFVTIFPCINVQATTGVRDAEQGMASGLVNASIQIGAAVGLAVVTAVVTAGTGAGSGPRSQLAGYRPGLATVLGIAVLGLLIAAVIGMLGRVRARPAVRAAAVRPADLEGETADSM